MDDVRVLWRPIAPNLDSVAVARFVTKVDISGGMHACWPWLGRLIWSGYGQFRTGGRGSKQVGAHRFALEIKLGRPIAPGMFACHTCDVRHCVNPAHLYEGDQADNMADMAVRGRAATGSRHSSRTHPERIARGERHGSRTHPERLPRGERNGAHTRPDRVLRGAAHGMAGTGKLTVADIARARELSDQGWSQRRIAVEFHVSQAAVWRALSGRLVTVPA